MVKFHNTLGTVSITNDYFAGLVSAAAQSCFGVAAMSTTGTTDDVKSLFFGNDFPEKGVRVTDEAGHLVIELHIKVTYGLNIAAIVKSITHKVKYAVEDATGLKVLRIDVSVDDIVTE
ncbi:MAG: Asp23/Gls24 family envelope stress response protein [Oscillospiraceae bacterium]|nr:Asp23/Gls24 family envelope stress response protein [Oscillospiraceae bacterium]